MSFSMLHKQCGSITVVFHRKDDRGPDGWPGWFVLKSREYIDVSWHADRYSSGALLYDALWTGAVDEHAEDPQFHVYELSANHLRDVYEATKEDGGNPGTIPCLGGDINEAWKWICEQLKEVSWIGE